MILIQVELPSPYHPMFELGLGDKEKKCDTYLTWVNYKIAQSQDKLQRLVCKRKCDDL